jgi:uncharacterized protein (DUF2235 family)
MGKRLVVCCDGTWNEPDQNHRGVAAPTNVAKLALGLHVEEAGAQRLFYEPGVGTSPDERIIGGAFGYGLSSNICDCYRWLALNYEPGDQLYLFGFSRGAYTARSLAGLIRNCGILRAPEVARADQAYAFYRDRTSQTHPSSLASQLFRKMYSHDVDDIDFIGVWDTVGALGIPTDLPLWKQVSAAWHGWEQLWGFHDTELSSHVRYAYHALAIDETRAPFKPTLWTHTDPTVEQTVEQVWFAGVHTEVGGGSADTGLSDIALIWMVEKARACGLEFTPGLLDPGGGDGAGLSVRPNYAGPLIDSRRGLYEAWHAYHRLEKLPPDSAPAQSIASSAVRRRDDQIAEYSPKGLDDYLARWPVMHVVENAPQGGGSEPLAHPVPTGR